MMIPSWCRTWEKRAPSAQRLRRSTCLLDQVWQATTSTLRARTETLANAKVIPFLVFGSILTIGVSPSFADRVQIGDVILDSRAVYFSIYYSSIPGVANPGQRPRNYESFAEVADALRRAKNNGWVVDFERSYMLYKRDSDSGLQRKSRFERANAQLGGTSWKKNPPNRGNLEEQYLVLKANGTFYKGRDSRSKLVSERGGSWTQNGTNVLLRFDSGRESVLRLIVDRLVEVGTNISWELSK